MVLHFQLFIHFSRSFAHIWELHMFDLFTIFTHFSSSIQISQPDAGTTWSWINLALGQGVDIVLSTQEHGAGSEVQTYYHYIWEKKKHPLTQFNSLTSYILCYFMLFLGRVGFWLMAILSKQRIWALFFGSVRFAIDLATTVPLSKRSLEPPKMDGFHIPHRIHGAAIYGNMDPINIPPMLAYIPYMDPMGTEIPRFATFVGPQSSPITGIQYPNLESRSRRIIENLVSSQKMEKDRRKRWFITAIVLN